LIYAGMWRRGLAFLADVCTFLLLAALMQAALSYRSPSIDLTNTIQILWLTSIILSLRFTGTTLGKYTFNIEVRSSRPGPKRPAIWELAMRETFFRWMSLLFFMGYIPAYSDSRHRSWSDRMANTVVVMRQKKRRRFIIILTGCVCALGFLLTALAVFGWAGVLHQ